MERHLADRDGAGGGAAPKLEITTSRQFVSWLAGTGGSLAFTTYQSGQVFLIGSKRETGRLSVFERTLERPMGMAASGARLAIATMNQVTTFVDAAAGGGATRDGYDAAYVPQVAHFTGDLDVHDIAFDGDGRIVFANTLFSCIAAVSETHSFRPLWKPPFVSRLAAEDRCHLNGLALRDGRPAYVTAVAATDIADGWRDNRADGGVVIDVASGETVCTGLSMPHSPRLHDGRLYVVNSGAGELGFVDTARGRFDPVAFCPGYLRGLAFLAGHAVIGLSEPRDNRTFAGLPLDARLAAERVAPRCGLYVIDLATGDVAHWLRLEGFVTELYDVVALPGVTRPSMIGFRSDEIRRTISIEG